MALGNASSFLVGTLLMLFIMPVIRVYDVVELAKLALEMSGLNFNIVQRRLYRLDKN